MGILVGFIGVYLMMMPELIDGFSWRGLGQVAVLGAAISYSFASMGCIFLGLIIIDGRTLKWLHRVTKPTGYEKQAES